MKKSVKLSTLILIMLLLVIGLSGCGDSQNVASSKTESKNETVQNEKTIEKKSILVYEDSYVKVVYTGIDYEETGLTFEITNKSQQDFSFAFDSILVNSKTEVPVYSAEILAGSMADYVCDVSSIDNINAITGNMYIYDSDGCTIEKFSVKDVSIK